jgi:hypothetical protein
MKKLMYASFIIFAYTFSATQAKALPFNPTAKDFQYFVNQVWQKGSIGNTYMTVGMQSNNPNVRRAYFGFYNCTYQKNMNSQRTDDFECLGYLDTYSPTRSVRCLINVGYTFGTANTSEAVALTNNPNASEGWYGFLKQYVYGTELSACRPI